MCTINLNCFLIFPHFKKLRLLRAILLNLFHLFFPPYFLFRAAMFFKCVKKPWKNEKKSMTVLNVESKSFGRK